MPAAKPGLSVGDAAVGARGPSRGSLSRSRQNRGTTPAAGECWRYRRQFATPATVGRRPDSPPAAGLICAAAADGTLSCSQRIHMVALRRISHTLLVCPAIKPADKIALRLQPQAPADRGTGPSSAGTSGGRAAPEKALAASSENRRNTYNTCAAAAATLCEQTTK